MTIEQLQADLDQANARRAEYAEIAKAIAAELNAARAVASVKAKLEEMSDSERNALASELAKAGNV